jgi:hypothetical protein
MSERWTIRICRECRDVIHTDACRYVGPLTDAPGEEIEVIRADPAETALRFYADPETWSTISPRGTVTLDTAARRDGGHLARVALS